MDSAGFFITLFVALTLLSWQVLIHRTVIRLRRSDQQERRYVSRRNHDRRKKTRPFILFDRRNGKMKPDRRLIQERREKNREGQ